MATVARDSGHMDVADYGLPSGLHAWYNFDQVPPDYLVSQDEQYCYTTWTIASAGNKGLKFTNLNMNIPVGSDINGILVEVWFKADSDTDPYFTDHHVQLMKNGSDVGDDLGDDVTHIPITAAKWEYGGFSDKWGTTWSYSEINASGFGVDICPKGFGTGNNEAVAIDYVTITVCYAGAYGHEFLGYGPDRAKKMIGVASTAVARVLGA